MPFRRLPWRSQSRVRGLLSWQFRYWLSQRSRSLPLFRIGRKLPIRESNRRQLSLRMTHPMTGPTFSQVESSTRRVDLFQMLQSQLWRAGRGSRKIVGCMIQYWRAANLGLTAIIVWRFRQISHRGQPIVD
jgi:hypothetical protein